MRRIAFLIPIAAVVLLGLLPVAMQVPATAALGLVAIICMALIAYEVLAHRQSRALIRNRRGAFTLEEIVQVERGGERKLS